MALDTNIVSFFNFDESSGNAADATGNGNTLTNTDCTYSTGLINNGVYSQTGYGNTSKMGTGSQGQSLSGAFSMAFWIKLRSNPGSGDFFQVVNWRGSSDLCIVKYFGSGFFGSPTLAVSLGTSDPLLTFATNLSTTVFQFVVNTVPASGTVNMYLNASVVDSDTRPSQSGGGNMTSFMQANDQTNNAGACIFDASGFWSRELTGAEVTELYNGGAGIQYPFPSTNIKTINGLANASVKTVNGLARASVKTWNGLS